MIQKLLLKENVSVVTVIAYEGQGAFPALVGTALSEDEVKDVLANGKGAMPAGLVPEENIDAMAAWVKSLE